MSVGATIIFQSAADMMRTLFLKVVDGRPLHTLGHHIAGIAMSESPGDAIAGHRQIMRLMQQPQMAPLLAWEPRLANRYFGSYLSTRFDKKARRQSFHHHYEYMNRHASQSFYKETLGRAPTLWERADGETVYSVNIAFNTEWQCEGDLSLIFSRNGKSLFRLSFAIVPGHLVGSRFESVLFVACVQGAKGHFEEIRRATKCCGEVAPQHLLLVAAQAVAQSLSVPCIGGIGNREQISRGSASDATFVFDYESFWRDHFAIRNDIYFEMPLPLYQKPLMEIAIAHRRRTRRKRRFKESVCDEIQESFSAAFLKR